MFDKNENLFWQSEIGKSSLSMNFRIIIYRNHSQSPKAIEFDKLKKFCLDDGSLPKSEKGHIKIERIEYRSISKNQINKKST